ncbi:MAG: BlaI/MecI/CopY family transcriptional regulator [Erysipelotrichaceae bacterium]|nr:BlaI/MecI/CopY family transcriptional regulator [Erysipelotrichaceae bacterium]
MNMKIKLFDSELKIMELLWKEGDLSAKQIAVELNKTIGWNRTTTYTVIRKCIEKLAIERKEPNFICHALISQNEVRKFETNELLNKMFNGSRDLLIATLLSDDELTESEIKNLKEYINSFE